MEPEDDLSNDQADAGIAPIRCQYCGATHNSRGKPLNAATLNQHLRKLHPHHFNEVRPDGALSCDLCGKWKSRSGPAFFSEADLARHRAFCTANVEKQASSRQNRHGGDTNVGFRATASARSMSSAEGFPGSSPQVSFCPQCGCNLHVVSAALAFVGKQ